MFGSALKQACLVVAIGVLAFFLVGCATKDQSGQTTTVVTSTTTTVPTGPTSTTTTATVTTTPAPPAVPLYNCSSNFELPKYVKMPQKGLCLDDTTFSGCADKVPGLWPNLPAQRVTSLRLFKSWSPDWGGDAVRHKAWSHLAAWVRTNNAKVLMGNELTCDEKLDNQTWKWDFELMKLLGKEHIMGLAVGNEMDIYYQKSGTSRKCIDHLWNERYWKTLQGRVADIDAAGFNDTKITIVWAMSVLGAPEGLGWKEDGDAKVNTLVTNAYKKWGDRWVWSFNVYAIWDTNLYPHNEKDCDAISKAAVSIDYTKAILKATRQRINITTGAPDGTIWVGENGWSSPMPVGHPTFPYCSSYASMKNFQLAYENFMAWDLSLPDGLQQVDHAFYFTMRDSNNMGATEHFGLVASCKDTQCKLSGSNDNNTNNTPSDQADMEIVV